MPVITGYGNRSIGRDKTIDIINPQTGAILDFGPIIDFSSTKAMTKLKSAPLQGPTIHGTVDDGWSGSITFERVGPVFDKYLAALEAVYYASGQVYAVSIQETIQEPDGSVSQFLYRGVALDFGTVGDWKRDAMVSLKLPFMASRREQVI